ncbi:hypothetical protein CRI93_06320 [Longimonas halophila]|uniref:Uncharacterized protein n=1 Tax=Longimonas halophila TaxID=1469170 RepID=A0A2H3P5S5_9BACT|nr:hypothetical protein CRI93_06320 [Longimonas halophila]
MAIALHAAITDRLETTSLITFCHAIFIILNNLLIVDKKVFCSLEDIGNATHVTFAWLALVGYIHSFIWVCNIAQFSSQ